MGSLDDLNDSVLRLSVTTKTVDAKSMPEILNAANTEIEQLRQRVAEQAKRIRHVEMALADTEALEMGTTETLGKAKARIKQLEDALREAKDGFKFIIDEAKLTSGQYEICRQDIVAINALIGE